MQTPELELSSDPKQAVRAGWRLRRLEMQNWGTFHWKIHRLVPDSGWSLVVGQNGSGKSTAIDALRTLLVPPRLLRRSYNDAAGEKRPVDRTRYSYVRGAWKSQATEVAAQGKPEYLRSESEHSTLLAVFGNESKRAAVTVAQILYLDGEKVDEIFLVATGDRNIRDHLSQLGAGTPAEWKRELKRRNWEVKDGFSAYAGRFTGLLGLNGDGALEVFNQAIGVKDVTSINDFVRNHMLEAADALEFIHETLQPHYKELNECWDAIQRAENQLVALAPIATAHERKAAAEARLAELTRLQQAAPFYYVSRHLELLQVQAGEIADRVQRRVARLNAARAEQEALDERCTSLDRAIHGSEAGKELARIDQEIGFARRRVREVEQRHAPWRQHLGTLALPIPVQVEEFAALRLTAATRKTTEETALGAAEEAVLAARQALDALKTDEESILVELRVARDRKVAIPAEFVRLRDALCDDTGLSTDSLPFTGELIEVKDEFREWTGAIERVLHGFAISLLVPEPCHDSVARWINGRHLGLRLQSYRVPERGTAVGNVALRPDRVAARLRYRTEHRLYPWTALEVARRFQHVCCEDTAQLARSDAGVTREGFVKEFGTRYVKDDRHHVDEARYWVLGWSAERKIRTLLANLEECRALRKSKEAAVAAATQTKVAVGKRLQALEAVLSRESFEEIDLDGAQKALFDLEHARKELLEAADEIKELERQLSEAKEQKAAASQKFGEATAAWGSATKEQEVNEEARAECSDTLAGFPDLALDELAVSLREYEAGATLTLGNVNKVGGDVAARLRGQSSQQTGIVNKAVEEMLPRMSEFLRDHPEYRGEMQNRVEDSAEFAALRIRLETDELPKHKGRFQKLMDESLVGGMLQFASRLKQHEDDIRQRIELVNSALRRIPFTNESYVQIKPAATANREIGEFRSRLKACFEGGLHPSAAQREGTLTNIRGLMEDFRSREDWTRRVTDARHWVEFGVRELAADDGRELNFLTGSGGRSGGQKAKLAFTILASAITAQYGLAESPDNPNSFRLVVIDEVFGHTDEEYSRQALDLFKNLGLQLIVVNPFDAKARIVEDYVDTFHLTANPERNNSRISRATRAEYKAAWNDTDTAA